MVQKLSGIIYSVLKCCHIEDNSPTNNYLYYFHYKFKKAFHSYQIKKNLKLNFSKKLIYYIRLISYIKER